MVQSSYLSAELANEVHSDMVPKYFACLGVKTKAISIMCCHRINPNSHVLDQLAN